MIMVRTHCSHWQNTIFLGHSVYVLCSFKNLRFDVRKSPCIIQEVLSIQWEQIKCWTFFKSCSVLALMFLCQPWKMLSSNEKVTRPMKLYIPSFMCLFLHCFAITPNWSFRASLTPTPSNFTFLDTSALQEPTMSVVEEKDWKKPACYLVSSPVLWCHLTHTVRLQCSNPTPSGWVGWLSGQARWEAWPRGFVASLFWAPRPRPWPSLPERSVWGMV